MQEQNNKKSVVSDTNVWMLSGTLTYDKYLFIF